MTEDEAKTKACCAGLGIGAHMQPDLPSFAACVGSRCMAWRWDGEVIWSNMSKAWLAKDVPEDAKTNAATGYCGLAGRP